MLFQEEQVKIRYERIMDKIKDNFNKSDGEDSSDDTIASSEENDWYCDIYYIQFLYRYFECF